MSLAHLDVEVTQSVEQRELAFELRCALQLLEDLLVLVDGLVVLILGLELAGLLLGLFDIQGRPLAAESDFVR
ncbi:MAG: hypothetical protein ACE5PT_03045 [Gemmatimonadales bacterium]